MAVLSPRKIQDAVQPLNGYIAVQEKESDSKSVIYVPKTAKEQPSLVEVVAAAKDVLLIKPGDVVIVPKYAGSIISIEGEEFLFIKAEDVLGKVTSK